MPTILRRLKALVVLAITWGIAWGVIGAAVGLVRLALDSRYHAGGAMNWLLEGAITFGIAGGLAGASFALMIGVSHRGRTIGQLKAPRIGTFGTWSGVLLIGVTLLLEGGFRHRQVTWPIVPTMVLGLLGGGTAVAMLVAARRGERLAAGEPEANRLAS